MLSKINTILNQVLVFKEAFEEQKDIINQFWIDAEDILGNSPKETPFKVELGKRPKEFLEFKRNFFSTLFLSMFHILNIKKERREIYGYINQLFRAWVTSADNLLDNEDKVTLDLNMPGNCHTMKQVVTIMIADRILFKKLQSAEKKALFTNGEILQLSAETLRVLLPAAAEEGMEEGGMKEWPSSEQVINKIHPVKTGLLFHIPFMGPELLEKGIDRALLKRLKEALMQFGVACQLLDDIRDLKIDFEERRANFVISQIVEVEPKGDFLIESAIQSSNSDNLPSLMFPEILEATLERSIELFNESFKTLDECGIKGILIAKKWIIQLLIKQLGLNEIKDKALNLI